MDNKKVKSVAVSGDIITEAKQGRKLSQTREYYLTQSLKQFFSDLGNLNKVVDILHSQNRISLRLLDWFVTNYAKKHNISYYIGDVANADNLFIVFHEYKSQLKGYQKRNFDPFCRTNEANKVVLVYNIDNRNVEVNTTVGQLNFFRWTIQKKIIDYVIKNIDVIEADMHETLKKTTDQKGKRRKRRELSRSAYKTVYNHHGEHKLTF